MIFQLLCLTAVILQSVSGSPTGPPGTACSTMDPSPGHGGSGQTSAAPYTMELSPTCYTIGQHNTVTLTSTVSGTNILGFFTQLRSSVDNSASYGTFNVGGNSDVRLVNCFGETANAIGQSMRISKTSTAFNWTPPAAAAGNYTFVTTVVQYQSIYWVKKVTSNIWPCSTVTTATRAPVTVDLNNTVAAAAAAATTATTTMLESTSLATTTGSLATQRSDAATVVVTTSLMLVFVATSIIIASSS